jgi:tellurite resistance protein TerC
MAIPRKEEIHPERNPVIRLFKRLFPISATFDGARFLTRSEGSLKATPLLVVLVAVETTDLVFAVDSIPAILAITQDAFIVFTSNIFAILGLRSFYFALSGIMQLFRFLSYGLAAVLTFIGLKMLISGYYHIPIEISLGLIAFLLGTSVALSLLLPEKTNPEKNIG